MFNLDDKLIQDIRKSPYVQNWTYISNWCNLSEEFIREFQDKVDWFNVSRRQKLSKSFIVEFLDKIDLKYLLINNNISQETKDYVRMFL